MGTMQEFRLKRHDPKAPEPAPTPKDALLREVRDVLKK